MEKEQISKVKGFPHYQVSSFGYVISLHGNKPKILKPFLGRKGYLKVSLHENGARFQTSVHRLVALAFIPNPDDHPEVNHLDENKENNSVTNLEWCTSLTNNIYSHGREVTVLDPQGVVQSFPSIGRFADAVPCNVGDASRLVRGLSKTVKGWRVY